MWKILVADYFQERIGQDKAVLDLRSGLAEFINNIAAKKKYAMDLNPDGRKLVNDDVEFLEQDCSTLWNVPDNSLDVVFTSNFFKHLPTKASLLDTMRQAHRSLKEGGKSFASARTFDIWPLHIGISLTTISSSPIYRSPKGLKWPTLK